MLVCVAIDPGDVLMGSGSGCKWSYKVASRCSLTVRMICGWFLFIIVNLKVRMSMCGGIHVGDGLLAVVGHGGM